MDIIGAESCEIDHSIAGTSSTRPLRSTMETVGALVSRYGLVVVLVLIGCVAVDSRRGQRCRPKQGVTSGLSPLTSVVHTLGER